MKTVRLKHSSRLCVLPVRFTAVFASVSFFAWMKISDTICDLGGVDELANYGEYSGAPSEQQTYDYAKTILSLMTREKHPDGVKKISLNSESSQHF